MEELVYTSAPQGLHQGSSGFCTVEMTEGMPPELMDSLETLSAYDNDPSKTVNWMHVQLNSVRGRRHILSRVGPLKGEFSGRTNKLAHHICLAPNELPPQGPMRIVGLSGPLKQDWSGEVRYLSPQATPTNLRVASMPRPCRNWEAAVGDAGVAGAILSKLRSSGSSPLWVIRTPQMDALTMSDEMLALLSGPERWSLTFCTYLHSLPRSVECRLRWVLPDSPAMSHVQNIGSDQLIDLRTSTEALLREADSLLVDAARSGKAVVAAGTRPAVGLSAGQASGPARRRGVSQVDLKHLAPTEATSQALPPPPPEQTSSPLKWVILGVGLGGVPALLLMFFLMRGDPAPAAAMRELEAEAVATPAVKVELEPAPEVVVSPKPDVQEPLPDTETVNDSTPETGPPPPPTTDQGPKIKSEIPITRTIKLRWPSGAFSVDRQPIHSAAGVYDVTLQKIPSVETKLGFAITDPDHTGERDLISRAPTGVQKKIGTIYSEPDRVMFAWSPETAGELFEPATFMLTHEVLIKDETHHNTIQFQFASLETLPTPPTPISRDFDLPVPKWLPTQFELLVKPTFVSQTPDQQIAFDAFVVHAPSQEPRYFDRKLNITSLQVDTVRVRSALFRVKGDVLGSGQDRRVRFSSTVFVDGEGFKAFEWPKLNLAVTELVKKYNEQEMKKNKKNRNLKTREEPLEVLEAWAKRLSCQLELYVRVGERNILWGKTAANGSSNDGGASK